MRSSAKMPPIRTSAVEQVGGKLPDPQEEEASEQISGHLHLVECLGENTLLRSGEYVGVEVAA
jgi:hypothetical protein